MRCWRNFCPGCPGFRQPDGDSLLVAFYRRPPRPAMKFTSLVFSYCPFDRFLRCFSVSSHKPFLLRYRMTPGIPASFTTQLAFPGCSTGNILLFGFSVSRSNRTSSEFTLARIEPTVRLALAHVTYSILIPRIGRAYARRRENTEVSDDRLIDADRCPSAVTVENKTANHNSFG